MPALLEPPRKRATPVFVPPPVQSSWKEKFARSGYLFGAVLLHLIVFLALATWVIFRAPPREPDDTTRFVLQPAPHPKQVTPAMPSTSDLHLPANPAPSPSNPAIHVPRPEISLDLPQLDSPILPGPTPQPSPSRSTNPRLGLRHQIEGLKNFLLPGQNRDMRNVLTTRDDPKNYKGQFVVYLASYADGDWNCNITTHDGAITAGSLPDLIAKIQEWSHGNIKASVMPTPLEIGGPDLMDKKPPFIFFTGHKDFVLTDDEVANLRQYLQNGGLIWGDNALPGRGSRFDVAFRREMKRVIPDPDKNFADVQLDHDIFRRGWFPMSELPTGMNYYAEPIQHLDLIAGKAAIIYTPNDYGDLFFMRILPGDREEQGPYPSPGSPLYTNALFSNYSPVFFRNFTLPSSLEAQKLGMNIIGYLLIRFDDDLSLAP